MTLVRPSVAARAAVVVVAVLLSVQGASGQTQARVRSEENVRREPNGEIVARVEAGAVLPVVGRQDRWLEVDLQGWVWARSLQMAEGNAFDLVVSEPQGENLRDAPSGAIVARLGRGTYLQEVERSTGWIRVSRRAWVWSESVVETDRDVEVAAGNDAPAAVVPGGFSPAGGSGAAILTSPDGDTLAQALAGTELEVMAREGSWARVRLEGWTWMPETATVEPSGDEPRGPLTPEDLAADPDGYRGRVVSWRLQFISLERAETVRTDFFEGEPFLLTRFGGPDGPFVYVAVPPDRSEEMAGLVPLERLEVTARVRTGSSALTSTPIIDLLALERTRDE